MNTDNNRSEIVMMRLLCFILGALVLIMLRKGCDNQHDRQSTAKEYEQKIRDINQEKEDIKAERDIIMDVVRRDETEKDSIIEATRKELSSYKEKSRQQKNDQFKKFQPKVSITDEGATIDSNVIDSINKYVIDCEGKKEELKFTDSIIMGQKKVIEKDSILLVKESEKFTIADAEAKKQATEATRQKQSAILWKRISIGLGGVSAVLITILSVK